MATLPELGANVLLFPPQGELTGNNAPKCCPWLDEVLNTCKNGLKKLIISLPADNSLETKEVGVTYVLLVFTTACISRQAVLQRTS